MSEIINVTEEFGPGFTEGLIRELKKEDDVKKAGYKMRQAAIARNTERAGRQVCEFGQKVATVDAYTFHSWGLAEGYECWGDNQFLHEFLRDNPECKAPGFWRGVNRKPKFHKNYGVF